ncbi:hypothetical protein NBRC111894_4244 [Sporolactobacillus inulinus]|uniref:Uncharacterized protein n=1 Tax=Sporolactobacillus inulinus TaxID=2078 RepID=A0A4Y1ZI58_9BACL|nr:hypothetical protein NBRC111894_4244 [Sporolactobacillus inulinus]
MIEKVSFVIVQIKEFRLTLHVLLWLVRMAILMIFLGQNGLIKAKKMYVKIQISI